MLPPHPGIIHADSAPFPQHPANPVPPSTPSAYTDIKDSPIAAPSSMEMASLSLIHGPAAGASPAGPVLYGRYEAKNKFDLKRHHNNLIRPKEYHCSFPKCTKSYTRKYTLKNHEKTHLEQVTVTAALPCAAKSAGPRDRVVPPCPPYFFLLPKFPAPLVSSPTATNVGNERGSVEGASERSGGTAETGYDFGEMGEPLGSAPCTGTRTHSIL
jgi:hypothetical protein